MNKSLRKIISHYGLDKQLNNFQIEVFKLNKAIINYNACTLENLVNDVYRTVKNCFLTVLNQPIESNPQRGQIVDELANIMITLKQIQLYYNISTHEIHELMKLKIKKQINSIEEDINEK